MGNASSKKGYQKVHEPPSSVHDARRKLINAVDKNDTELTETIIDDIKLNFAESLESILDCSEISLYWTPLHFAARHSNYKIMIALLEAGARPNLMDLWGRTPCHVLACEYKLHKASDGAEALREEIDESSAIMMVRALNEHGNNVNQGDNDNLTPLHLACENDTDDMILALLENGANPNIQDAWGRTPYLIAVKRKRSDAVLSAFRRAEGDPTIHDNDGRSVESLLQKQSRTRSRVRM